MGKLRVLVALLLTVALLPAMASAQQQGAIEGTVLDRETGAPLGSAQITVQGTTLRVVTDAQGRYRVGNVPAGQVNVTASQIGRESVTQAVTVVAGQTATANFRLASSVLALEGLIVTATGREQRQREIGAAVSSINVTEVEMAPISNASQLLQGRVPGAVVMQTSGTTGAGSRVRIRGNNSISLSNAPLIILDGVRVENSEASLGFGVGGATPSRLNDINPNDIESIEVLKGPAASSLYGTAAANGVIQITTRRGRAGAPQFRLWSELGRFEQDAPFPDNVWGIGPLVSRNAQGQLVPALNAQGQQRIERCDINRQATAADPNIIGVLGCTGVTTMYRGNPLRDPETTPFRTGERQTLGGSVSGGSDAATYYLSSEYEEELGVMQDNSQRRVRLQANLTGNVSPRLNVGANIGFLENRTRLPLGDNALFGIVPMGLFGLPTPENVAINQGFEDDPGFHYDWKTFQDFSRITGSVRSAYRPLPWLSVNGIVGLDRYARTEVNRLPRVGSYNVFGGIYAQGWIQNYNYHIYDLTSNASATAVFNLSPDLVSTTSVGTQFIRETLNRIYAFGATLTPGIETSLSGATTNFSTSETNSLNATVGGYGSQQLAWRDRVFLNGALRGDRNTAFGSDIGWIFYPSVSGAWVVSEEPFFPQATWLSNLRLRAAYGQSGLRPGATDALLSFTGATAAFQAIDAPAIIFNEVGNPDLRPERSTEIELGFESGLVDDRIGFEMTYFNKRSTDALVNKPLPPSLGAGANRFENLGRVDNNGLELLLRAQPLRRQNVEWNFSVSGSFLRNELVDLGLDAQGNPIPPVVFGAQRHTEGYPLGSWFLNPIVSYEDVNGDGILRAADVIVRTDTFTFHGNPFPTRELAFSSDVSFGRNIRLSALMDYKGGHQMLNYTEAFRCGDKLNCEAFFDPTTPLDMQAAVLARAFHRTYAGFVEDADFLKLREVALTLGVPTTVTRRLGTNALSVTLAGRNLRTWTDYSGFDPEVSWGGGANFSSGDFATLPPTRTWTVRFDANF